MMISEMLFLGGHHRDCHPIIFRYILLYPSVCRCVKQHTDHAKYRKSSKSFESRFSFISLAYPLKNAGCDPSNDFSVGIKIQWPQPLQVSKLEVPTVPFQVPEMAIYIYIHYFQIHIHIRVFIYICIYIYLFIYLFIYLYMHTNIMLHPHHFSFHTYLYYSLVHEDRHENHHFVKNKNTPGTNI